MEGCRRAAARHSRWAMKLHLPPLASALFLLVVGAAGAVARDRLPIVEFARSPATARARLSPDGKYLAYTSEESGRQVLRVLTIDTKEVKQLNLGESQLVNNMAKEVADFQWVNNRRLLIHTAVWDSSYGTIATNADGSNGLPISGYENERLTEGPRLWVREVIHRFYDEDGTVLMLDRHEDSPGRANRPDVVQVNTSTGISKTVVKNPGEVGSWVTDASGVVRIGILSHGDLSGVIYRENAKSEWKTILPLKDRRAGMRPLGFESATDRLLVGALTEQKRWTIFPIDPHTGEMGQPLLADPEYDILPERFTPAIDGNALAAPFFSPTKDALLGLRYVTEAPRVKWFDPEFERMQRTLDRMAKETVNLLVGVSNDGQRQLWFGFSDQSPGVYYLADLGKKSIKPLAQRMPWIKPAEMAPMLSIKYPARDGLLIHGFLTVPVGHEPRNLPLVVLPHGGPWVRDVWGFEPLVQLLANRGYAVLQMNYRGSPGYGDELFKNARRQIGRQVQDDIEDGTRWAIASGVADPKRIAILGGSYGGYSALFALGHNPELYRCGISFAGVTDWYAMYFDSDVADYKSASRYWREQIGDPETDRDALKQISPVNFAEKIKAPVLIIQGKEDRRVPPDQARRMISALEKTGAKPESLFLGGVGHSFGREHQRVQIWTAMVSFLEKHLGPGVD